MKISRRRLILSSAVIGVSGTHLRSTFAADSVPASPKAFTVQDTTDKLVRIYASRGLQQVQAAPMITGHHFNGGLNYDDSMFGSVKSEYIIQPASRVEDAVKKNKPGTLPLFTIFAAVPGNKNVSVVDNLKRDIQAVIVEFGLKPELIRVTSTELINPYLQILLDLGISQAQIRVRPLALAKEAGDGSGWFAPSGHPLQSSYPTFSLEYQMPDGTELEFAEFDLSPVNSCGIGFGIERLTMARNNAYFTWDEYLPKFKQIVENDARDNKKKLPAGYYTIIGQPQPA